LKGGEVGRKWSEVGAEEGKRREKGGGEVK
jgi:hypothetical protein